MRSILAFDHFKEAKCCFMRGFPLHSHWLSPPRTKDLWMCHKSFASLPLSCASIWIQSSSVDLFGYIRLNTCVTCSTLCSISFYYFRTECHYNLYVIAKKAGKRWFEKWNAILTGDLFFACLSLARYRKTRLLTYSWRVQVNVLNSDKKKLLGGSLCVSLS